MTTASAGASTVVPTATILPSRRSIAPLRIVGPGRGHDGDVADDRRRATRSGRYVLGKGSAFGVETAPSIGPVLTLSVVRAGAGGVAGVASCARPEAHALAARATASAMTG